MDWSFAMALAGVIIAIVTVGVSGYQNRSVLRADIHLRLLDRWEGDAMRKARKKVANDLQKGKTTSMFEVLYFFETVGPFLRQGSLDHYLAWSSFYVPLNIYWQASQTHVATDQAVNNTMWIETQYLHDKLSRIERRQRLTGKVDLTQEDIAKFLVEEAAL